MSKRELFSFAGIATSCKNTTKVRYTNNLTERLKILERDKFTNVAFVELPSQMNKKEACKYLLTLPQYQAFQQILHDEISKK